MSDGRAHFATSATSTIISAYRPEGVDYTRPEKLGIKDAVNFYLSSKDGAKIGVWHLGRICII